MRNIITTLATAIALAASGIATAQPARSHLHTPGHRHFASPFPSKWQNTAKAAAKTTATDVRMIGIAQLEYNGAAYIPFDSVEIAYNALHGGTFNEVNLNWQWNFDTAYSHPWTGSAYGAREYRYWQHFNSADVSDTFTYDEWSGTAWQAGYRSLYTYDAANNLLSATGEDWDVTSSSWQASDRQVYTYTPANKLESETYESWSGSAWDATYRIFHAWSTPGLLVEDSSQYWDASLPGWVDAQKLLYTYDGADNRIETTACFWADTTWDTVGMAYASGFVSNHQPQTIVYTDESMTPGVYDSSYREHYTYNSYGKPTYYYDEEWNTATSSWVKTTSTVADRMYYEEYGAGVGVGKEIAVKNLEVVVYPVPARDNITVAADWGASQTLSGTITDMAGRVYTSWSGTTAGRYRETIPVSNLPAGSYLLTIQGRDGSATKQFAVVR